MTKQTWRIERFRSNDIRRNIHQQTAEIARITKTLRTRNKPKEKKQTVNQNKASKQKLPLWQKIFFAFIGATIFSSMIFAIEFITFGLQQVAMDSFYFSASEFNTMIGSILITWLFTFIVIWQKEVI